MNKREQNKMYRECIVNALARYGYLRVSDVAVLVYSGKKSAVRMAQRMLAEMSHDRLLIVARDGRCAEAHFSLSEAGARAAVVLRGEPVRSGKDVLRGVSAHRDASNAVCCAAQAAGLEVITDREMCTREDRVYAGKVPDGVVIERWWDEDGDAFVDYEWVEVENSYRSQKDLETLAKFVCEVFRDERSQALYREGSISKVRVVIANRCAARIGERLAREVDKLRGTGAGRALMTRGCVSIESLLAR